MSVSLTEDDTVKFQFDHGLPRCTRPWLQVPGGAQYDCIILARKSARVGAGEQSAIDQLRKRHSRFRHANVTLSASGLRATFTRCELVRPAAFEER